MYAIYAYIDPPNHPNVGKYAIHGVSGIYSSKKKNEKYVNQAEPFPKGEASFLLH